MATVRLRLPVLLASCAIVLTLSIAGAASSASPSSAAVSRAVAKVTVPNVLGLRMDRATKLLHSKGLRVNEECTGLLGCIIKSNWWICGQTPRAGRVVNRNSVVVIFGVRRGEC